MSISIILGKDPQAGPKMMDSNLRVPKEGRFYQVFHPWQQAKFNYKPLQSVGGFEQPYLPMPTPLLMLGCRWGPSSDYQQMHESWQTRYFELYRFAVGPIPKDGKIIYWYEGGEGSKPYKKVPAGTLHANPRFEPGSLLDAYSHIFEDHRSHTDGAAFNTENFWGRDIVMGCHLENPKTWRMRCLTWPGSIVQRHEDPPGRVPADYMAVKAWDHTKPAPPLDILLAPDAPPLWWGVEGSPFKLLDQNGKTVLWDGRPSYQSSHFPWLKLVCRANGLPEIGTPFFPIGIDGWNLVRKDDLHQVENGQPYSPYWPMK